MIVGGYSLDLYCRFHQASGGKDAGARPHSWNRGIASFAGHNENDCKKQARKARWKFNRGDVVCPDCQKKAAE